MRSWHYDEILKQKETQSFRTTTEPGTWGGGGAEGA